MTNNTEKKLKKHLTKNCHCMFKGDCELLIKQCRDKIRKSKFHANPLQKEMIIERNILLPKVRHYNRQIKIKKKLLGDKP
jgi:hypothetical protein